MDEEEFGDFFPDFVLDDDYTEMWDEIKNEWDEELFYNLDEDEETEEEDE